MKATLKNYRQSPRKVRLVTNLIKGKRVDYAFAVLEYNKKRAAKQIKKILGSALANTGEEMRNKPEQFYVKEASVDEGVKLRRFTPRAFGRATPVFKRSSHIKIELSSESKRTTEENKKTESVS